VLQDSAIGLVDQIMVS